MNPCKLHEPKVIDNALLEKCVKDQGPKGEAGRLADLEGIQLEEVTEIRLEFQNILKIDHLWVLTSLTRLCLNNNLIEKIENLDTLVHLVELNLSFNKISKIENLDELKKLEKLSFYDNEISVLENMNCLTKLSVFSIGRNKLDDLDNILYLRRFPNLKSLNLVGNPVAETEDFRLFIAVFLPQVVYYEYKLIYELERELGHETFRSVKALDPNITKLMKTIFFTLSTTIQHSNAANEPDAHPLPNIEDLFVVEYNNYSQIDFYFAKLRALLEKEKKETEAREIEEQERADAELHALSFVEYLNTRHLFDALFADDRDGKALLDMGDEAKEFYDEYEEQFLELCKQIFQNGQAQYLLRKAEYDQFLQCVEEAKKINQEDSIKHMEVFLEKKAIMFYEIKLVQNLLNMNEISYEEFIEKCDHFVTEYDAMLHEIWKALMKLELELYEQMEDVNQNFEQGMTELVNNFVESSQAFFSQIRELEVSYSENIGQTAVAYQTNANLNEDFEVPESLSYIMSDKEILHNAVAASHDMHMQVIDGREDSLMSKARGWLEELVDNLTKNEIKRNRGKVLEINHFLDIQREEFEDLNSDYAPEADADVLALGVD